MIIDRLALQEAKLENVERLARALGATLPAGLDSRSVGYRRELSATVLLLLQRDARQSRARALSLEPMANA